MFFCQTVGPYGLILMRNLSLLHLPEGFILNGSYSIGGPTIDMFNTGFFMVKAFEDPSSTDISVVRHFFFFLLEVVKRLTPM